MFDKYGNILTMLLVIFIVAIFGIVGYFVYDLLNSNNINENAQSAIQEFENATQTIKNNRTNTVKNTVVENTTVEETNTVIPPEVNPLEELNQLTQNQVEEDTTVEDVEDREKVYMEDYEVMGTIKIPKTGIEYPVLDEVTKRSLELSVGIAYGPGLNEVGNTIIYGHNYRNGLFFSNNKKLANGDLIYITDVTGETVTYEIYNIYQTTPNDASYFTRDTEGRREISLQTCTDDSSGRIIVWAVEK